MFNEQELQTLFRQCFALTGEREGAVELLYDAVKAFAHRHPKGLKQAFPYAHRFVQEFAASRGIQPAGAQQAEPADEPVLAPEGAVEPLGEKELARIEGVMAGLSMMVAISWSEDSETGGVPQPWYNRLGKPWQRGLVALIAILLLLLIPSREARITTPERAMEEMERIHLEGLAPEFQGGSVRDAASKVAGVGFEPVEPKVVPVGERWKIQGAARCQLPGTKGCVVVSLSEPGSGERFSLIEAPLPEGFEAEGLTDGSGLEGEHRGTVVRLWEEQGLLLALVGPREKGSNP